MDIEERASQQRDNAKAKAARIAQRRNDAAFWDGTGATPVGQGSIPATTGSNGPLRAGQSVPLLQAGGIMQVDTFSRSQPDEPLNPVITTYPFKTLLWVAATKTLHLGGDRKTQLLTTATQAPFYFALVNSGKLTAWQTSYLDSFVTPKKLKFILPSEQKDYTVRGGSNPRPAGQNIWMDTSPAYPTVSEGTRITVLGNPPAIFTFSQDVDPEFGQTNTFSVRYPFTARLVDSPWAPYSASPLPIGELTWSQTTLYDGATPANYPHQLDFTSLDHTETRTNNITTPIRVFRYDSTTVEPSVGFEGVEIATRNFVKRSTMTRSQTYETMAIAQNHTDQTTKTATVEVTFIGNQKRSYLSKNNKTETYTLTDNRSTGGGGASMSWDSSLNSSTDTITNNPLAKVLFGDETCFIWEFVSGQTEMITRTETKTASGGAETIGANPSMNSQSLVDTLSQGIRGYIVSASTSQGSGGGWLAPGVQPAPAASIYRYGASAPGLDYPIDPKQLLAGTSIPWAAFDSPGAYGDNSIWPERGIFTRLTAQIAPSIVNAWQWVVGQWTVGSHDSPPTQSGTYGTVTTKRFGRNYSSVTVTRQITNYPAPINYILLTETETFEVDPQQAYIQNGLLSSYVINPPTIGSSGTLTISHTAQFIVPIFVTKNRLKTKDATTTVTLEYTGGATTPSVNTSVSTTTYTSDASDIIGLACEVYRLVNGVITRWTGTVTSYSGSITSGTPQSTATNIVVLDGPHPVTTDIRNIAIAVSKTEVVPMSPFPIANNQYTLVINPDFALVYGGGSAPTELRQGVMTPELANLQAGRGVIATAYVASKSYSAGKKNYAAVWDFVKQPDGKVKIVKRDRLVSGSTKADTGLPSGVLQAVQWFG
jgi:hypothetical protein